MHNIQPSQVQPPMVPESNFKKAGKFALKITMVALGAIAIGAIAFAASVAAGLTLSAAAVVGAVGTGAGLVLIGGTLAVRHVYNKAHGQKTSSDLDQNWHDLGADLGIPPQSSESVYSLDAARTEKEKVD